MTVTGKGDFPLRSVWVGKNSNRFKDGTLCKTLFYANADQSLKTIMSDWFFESGGVPSFFGILKRWNGATWVKEPLKTYLGSWQAKPLKRFDSTWKQIDTTGI